MMPIDIFTISNIFNWTTNLLALIAAFLYSYRNFSPAYLRVFPIYLFLALAAEVLANRALDHYLHIEPYPTRIRFIIFNIFTVVELCSFAWFLFHVIRSRKVKMLLIAELTLFCLFFPAYWLWKGPMADYGSSGVVIEVIIIIVPCLTFFRELFTRNETVDLTGSPSFWLVTGIFFYLVTIFPLYLTRNYLHDHGLAALIKSLHSINNFAISITYLIFIRAFICRTKKS